MARGDLGEELLDLAVAIAGVVVLFNALRSYGVGAGLSFRGQAPTADFANMLGLPYSISDAGRQAIKDQEKFSPYPYNDGKGHQSVAWGHQIQPGESFQYPVSFDVGESVFNSDIGKVESTINSTVTVPLNQGQVDAIGDFIFRIGVGNWASSQLLADLNAGNYAAAATDFSHFIRTNGQVSSALVARAGQEQQTFSGGAA